MQLVSAIGKTEVGSVERDGGCVDESASWLMKVLRELQVLAEDALSDSSHVVVAGVTCMYVCV